MTDFLGKNLSSTERIIYITFSIIVALAIVMFSNVHSKRSISLESIFLMVLYTGLIYCLLNLIVSFDRNKLDNIESFLGDESDESNMTSEESNMTPEESGMTSEEAQYMTPEESYMTP